MIVMLPIDQIPTPGPNYRGPNYRGRTSREMLHSLQREGLKRPIAVERIGKDKYKLLDGYDRLTNAKLLGWRQIAAKIVESVSLPAADVFKPNVGWPPVWTGWSK